MSLNSTIPARFSLNCPSPWYSNSHSSSTMLHLQINDTTLHGQASQCSIEREARGTHQPRSKWLTSGRNRWCLLLCVVVAVDSAEFSQIQTVHITVIVVHSDMDTIVVVVFLSPPPPPPPPLPPGCRHLGHHLQHHVSPPHW